MDKMKSVRSGFVTLLVGVLLVGGLGLVPAHATSTTLNNVQVFVQTTNADISSYSLTAYNSSGYQVASSTNTYAGFGLELPSGTYLITVTATPTGSDYPIVYATGVATPSNGSSGVVSPPIKEPVIEYGYVLQSISGPVSLNIKTAPIDNVATTNVHMSVSFANGTAASGVWVDGSVVGSYYYGGSNTVMDNQTGAGGSVTLMVPDLPILLQGYISLPINVPETTTTTTTTVGGQPVNVTMYWEPNYVELTGTALIIPPQTSAQMTLQVQQSNYMVEPLASDVSSGVASTTTIAAPSAGSNSTTPSQLPAFNEAQLGAATIASSVSTGPVNTTGNLALIMIIVALVAIASVAAFRFRKTS